jgi:hypothetical protein
LTEIVKQQRGLTANRGLQIAEVGSWLGESAITMLQAADRQARVHCIDHWRGTNTADGTANIVTQLGGKDVVRDIFRKNVAQLGEDIVPLEMESEKAADTFSDGCLDIVFIDAEHTENAVAADIKAWWPKVRYGGILCGHDYFQDSPGVVKAVDAAFDKPMTFPGTSIWYVRKEGESQAKEPARAVGRYKYVPGPEPLSAETTDTLIALLEQVGDQAGPDAFIRMVNLYPGDGQVALAMQAAMDRLDLTHDPTILCLEPGEWKAGENVDDVNGINGVSGVDVIEEALTLPQPEELDAVVIRFAADCEGYGKMQEAIDAWAPHVRNGGLLVLLDPERHLTPTFRDDMTWIEDTGIGFLVKAGVEVSSASP